MKLTKEQKRGIARKVDLEAGIVPPKSAVFKNKKKYNRKKKHKDEKNNQSNLARFSNNRSNNISSYNNYYKLNTNHYG